MKTIRLNIALTLFLYFFLSIPAEAGFFNRCDFMEERPVPSWFPNGIYLSDYYFGIGMSEKRDSFGEQTKSSENDAIGKLSQSISVEVSSSMIERAEETSKGGKRKTEQSVSLMSEFTSKNMLREMKIKDKWLDRDKCILYTLAVVSRESVENLKNEIIMKDKLNQMKDLLQKGLDKGSTSDMGMRKKYLEDSRHFLDAIDFKYLPAEVNKEVYYNQVNSALEKIEKEIASRQGIMLVASLNENDGVPGSVKGKLLDYVRQGIGKADRLIGDYNSLDEVLKKAGAQGFSLLGIVRARKKVEINPMGAFKGTLEASLTVYNVETGNIYRDIETSFAQIIGWTEDELTWDVAAEKIIQGDKILFKDLVRTENNN